MLRDSCIRIRELTGQSKSLVDGFVADPSSVAVDGMAIQMAGERGTVCLKAVNSLGRTAISQSILWRDE